MDNRNFRNIEVIGFVGKRYLSLFDEDKFKLFLNSLILFEMTNVISYNYGGIYETEYQKYIITNTFEEKKQILKDLTGLTIPNTI